MATMRHRGRQIMTTTLLLTLIISTAFTLCGCSRSSPHTRTAPPNREESRGSTRIPGTSSDTAQRQQSVGTKALPQPKVPQYIIADAALFNASAIYAARVLQAEQDLKVVDVQPLLAQAYVLCNSTARLSSDLADLKALSLQTNPAAVPLSSQASAESAAAMAAATQFRNIIRNGGLGPAYAALDQSALVRLEAARDLLQQLAESYNFKLPPITKLPSTSSHSSK